MKEDIIIFTGSFGSGKTEIAINQSLKMLERKERVFLVDLDIVNPYFRTRDKREKLAKIGVEVIAPEGKLALADLPLISPEVKGTIQDSNRILLIDVGGDEIGAKALAGFYPVLKDTGYQLNMVVNPYRPFTRNVEQIEVMLKDIELFSRLKINGIVSNPNLEEQTDLEIIKKGHKIVQQAAARFNLPIRYLTIEKSVYKKISPQNFNEEVVLISRYMELPWNESEEEIINKKGRDTKIL